LGNKCGQETDHRRILPSRGSYCIAGHQTLVSPNISLKKLVLAIYERSVQFDLWYEHLQNRNINH